jgi:ABC-2 type transport system ATP-binding protein
MSSDPDVRTGPPAIETIDLAHAYGSTVALSGIDLRVGGGEIHALVGANGSGKTTTVRILATLLSPSSGIARVLGIDVRRDPTAVRRRIGVALQEVGLDPLATGAELLRLQARLRGLGRPAAGRRAQELLELLGLSAVADRRITTYSGGTRRRLDLASALVCSPRLLLLDEPTTGLDPTSRVGVWREISRLRDAGTAVLLTTQYLDEADRLADHVWVLNQGHVARHGTPTELKAGIVGDGVTVELHEADRDRALRALGELSVLEKLIAHADGVGARAPDGAAVASLITERLRACGVTPRRVIVSPATLEDVFERVASPDRVAEALDG